MKLFVVPISSLFYLFILLGVDSEDSEKNKNTDPPLSPQEKEFAQDNELGQGQEHDLSSKQAPDPIPIDPANCYPTTTGVNGYCALSTTKNPDGSWNWDHKHNGIPAEKNIRPGCKCDPGPNFQLRKSNCPCKCIGNSSCVLKFKRTRNVGIDQKDNATSEYFCMCNKKLMLYNPKDWNPKKINHSLVGTCVTREKNDENHG